MKMILIGIFYIFGLFELITNIMYLAKDGGIRKAYGQHREIPSEVTEQRMKIKVITMLFVGIGFTSGLVLLSLKQGGMAGTVQKTMIFIYALYTVLEAAAYRKHKLGWALAGLVVVLGTLYMIF